MLPLVGPHQSYPLLSKCLDVEIVAALCPPSWGTNSGQRYVKLTRYRQPARRYSPLPLSPPRSLMKNARLLAIAAVATSIPLIVSGCGGADAAESSGAASVSVGVVPGVDLAPLYLGIQEGVFDELNLTVTINSLSASSSSLLTALGEDRFDFGYADTLSVLSAIEGGAAIDILSGAAASSGNAQLDYAAIMVRPDSDITSLSNLTGRTIGVDSRGSTNEFVMRDAMLAANVPAELATWKTVPFVDAVGSINSGAVDAALVTEPFLTTARLAGMRIISYPYAEFDRNLTVSMYVASSAFTEKKPEVVERFRMALQRSYDLARTKPGLVRDSLTSFIKTGADVRTRLTLPSFTTHIDTGSVTLLGERAKKFGMIQSIPDFATILP
ncbi:hypothetical protein C2138_01340 [Salinibacterium hongtaonis]|nr:hypothetical protein C2138_01340 [Salinibacterium hongtaonis]